MSRIDLPLQPNGYKVQWSYLPKQFSAQKIEEILDLFRKFVPTGDFTLGKPVREFEQSFAAMIGTRHAIGVNSGPTRSSSRSRPSASDRATRSSPRPTRSSPPWGRSRNLCPSGVRRLHGQFLHGRDRSRPRSRSAPRRSCRSTLPAQMTDMPALMKIAQKHELPVVEDACQCILGNIDGKKSGTFGRSGGLFASSAQEPQCLGGRRHDRHRRR